MTAVLKTWAMLTRGGCAHARTAVRHALFHFGTLGTQLEDMEREPEPDPTTEPEPAPTAEPSATDDEIAAMMVPSAAELASEHPTAITAQHEGASPRTAERAGFEAMLKESHSRYRKDILEQTTEISEAFKCCITHHLMTDPVVDPEGNTYERSAIMTWLQHNSTSPVTRANLTSDKLSDNRVVRNAIEAAGLLPAEINGSAEMEAARARQQRMQQQQRQQRYTAETTAASDPTVQATYDPLVNDVATEALQTEAEPEPPAEHTGFAPYFARLFAAQAVDDAEAEAEPEPEPPAEQQLRRVNSDGEDSDGNEYVSLEGHTTWIAELFDTEYDEEYERSLTAQGVNNSGRLYMRDETENALYTAAQQQQQQRVLNFDTAVGQAHARAHFAQVAAAQAVDDAEAEAEAEPEQPAEAEAEAEPDPPAEQQLPAEAESEAEAEPHAEQQQQHQHFGTDAWFNDQDPCSGVCEGCGYEGLVIERWYDGDSGLYCSQCAPTI